MTPLPLQLTAEQYAHALAITPSEQWRFVFRVAAHLMADLEEQGVMSPQLLSALVGAAWRTAELTEKGLLQ